MNNPLATYIEENGEIEERLLDQLASNEKMAELGRMAASIVHELNTPLSVIVSATQMILREEELGEFVREMVERVQAESHRLAELTRGLLTFARDDEAGNQETDANQVLREVMAFMKYEAQKRSVTVVEELDFRISAIAGGPNRLKQICLNLVMNALQAMEAGGILSLQTRMADDDTVQLQVSDTGAGISSEVLGQIFTPFFTTKEPGTGTGLGLYVTMNLVKGLGGRIAVNSTVGEGTTFTLRFPAVIG